MNLTKNFTLEEMTYSITAQQNKINNKADANVINNLKQLAINVLQPLRDYLGCRIIVTSGYRCPALNRKIGGAINSQHLTGNAADIVIPAKKLSQVYNYIKDNLPYDQLLFETNKSGDKWIHVSYSNKNRKQALKLSV